MKIVSIIIFIIILSGLVFIHEIGHLLAAKRAGIRVDEFGFGFPPRATTLFEKWGTKFTLNWIPFGGFVKIFGENPSLSKPPSPVQGERLGGEVGSFQNVSKKWQAVVLAAGVTFNFILAWILISAGFLIGMPYSTQNELGAKVKNPELTVINILPESPAFTAGLKSGDVIKKISRKSEALSEIKPTEVSEFINKPGDKIYLEIIRNKTVKNFEIIPSESVIDGKFALGISMDEVGILQLPLPSAIWHGLKTSVSLLIDTTRGLGALLIDAFRGRADLSQITGPVGIIGIVGDAEALGFVYILTLSAFISINLAVINLLPFPSLDGGRILFVLIEAIKGSPVNPRVFNWANTIGFAILILLMLTITIRDIGNLF